MHQVWLTARTDFTFKGISYTAGQVFSVEPLVAVQMYAARHAYLSRAPTTVYAEAAQPVTPSRKRRTYTTKQMTATPPQAAPEPTPEPAQEPEPSAEPQAEDQNTYDRKDLRADGE